MHPLCNIPCEGTLEGEYAPKSMGRKLRLVSLPIGVSTLAAIPVLWLRRGSPPSAWTMIVIGAGMFFVVTLLVAATHFAGRGMRLVLDFDARRLVVMRRRRSGATSERTISFSDILRIEFQEDKFGGEYFRACYRRGHTIVRDSLSNYAVIKRVMIEIADQTDDLPIHRTTGFQMTVVIVVMLGSMGAVFGAFLLGWI